MGKITLTFIKNNKQLLKEVGIINGVGVPGTWYTKGLKFILYLDNKKRSFFYDAASYHDVLYWSGGNRFDKLKADVIFLIYMLQDCMFLKKKRKFLKYMSIALFYFFAVLFFGNSKKAFHRGQKRTTTDVYRLKKSNNERIIDTSISTNEDILQIVSASTIIEKNEKQTVNMFVGKRKRKKLIEKAKTYGIFDNNKRLIELQDQLRNLNKKIDKHNSIYSKVKNIGKLLVLGSLLLIVLKYINYKYHLGIPTDLKTILELINLINF